MPMLNDQLIADNLTLIDRNRELECDLTPHLAACEERNRERGRYGD